MNQSTANNPQRQNTSTPNNSQNRPQNKDHIDSRSNEEWDTKGDDVTHNQKEHKSDRKNVKND